MKEALRYLNNAKQILKSAPLEDGTYTDIKPVREACGIAYLAVLMAIDENLLKRGLSKKELPRSVIAYRKAVRKYLAVHNGKLLREFEAFYEALHIAGYYTSLFPDTESFPHSGWLVGAPGHWDWSNLEVTWV